ncbi:hypothetical protein, partial [Hominenteromicrobium sp.]|uniref:hypothetical protein n=1 Tax=Hominenteromicrobium sp. TaxID=3073581 RepID=UPI003AB1D79A
MIKGYADKAADVFGNDAAKTSAALSDKRQYDNITKNVRKSSEIILPPLAHQFCELSECSLYCRSRKSPKFRGNKALLTQHSDAYIT